MQGHAPGSPISPTPASPNDNILCNYNTISKPCNGSQDNAEITHFTTYIICVCVFIVLCNFITSMANSQDTQLFQHHKDLPPNPKITLYIPHPLRTLHPYPLGNHDCSPSLQFYFKNVMSMEWYSMPPFDTGFHAT